MAEVRLQAERRIVAGKGGARKTRAAGKVPAIVYGGGMEPIPVQVDRRELVTALHTDAGMNVLLDLAIGDTTTLALTRELQRDPVRGTLLHADFVKVDRTQEIEVEVPIHLIGEAPGVREGGVLEHQLFTAHVRCLPTAVPEHIEADISPLGPGDALKVADLVAGRDYEILNEPDTVVALIAAAVSAEELEAMEAAVSGEAPEVAEAVVEAEAATPAAEGPEEETEAAP
jgi:large subunit ribosomal protein L25